MKKISYLILIPFILACSKQNQISGIDFTTKFEKSGGMETPTYHETIAYYEQLSNAYPEISMIEMGETDSGYPLHLVVFSSSREFDFRKLNKASKNVVLINNNIHPGESDGVDASMMLLRDIVQNRSAIDKLKNVVIAVIPMYNIGGAFNRSATSRANQNGPKEYGFRGNTRNYDLNRDFIKSDTKNTRAFAKLYHHVQPDVFIDTHVSNGADYQYALTHLFTQHNKLGNDLGVFIESEMRPSVESSLLKKNIPITPYVNVWRSSPKEGFSQFFDSPRYSTGYTTLFNTLGMMIETHMLKPYKQRVEQTYSLIESMIDFTADNGSKIKSLRKNAVSKFLEKKFYPITYKLEKETFSTISFSGYESSYIKSKVTSGKRLFYDKSKPYTVPIKYFNQFEVGQEISIPKGYILKQGWWKVLDRMKENSIEYTLFTKDTIIKVEELHIKSYKTRTSAYEGHYPHYNTIVSKSSKEVLFRVGDLFIPINQTGARYLMETLEAEATDSFFNWNYFDTILHRKEGYSSYVFEDIAEQLLIDNQWLKDSLEAKMLEDSTFADNPRAQLDFIYKNSPYYEPAHLRLPVYKVF